jgi:hypothetical protein
MIGKNAGGYLGKYSVYIGQDAGRLLTNSGNIEIVAGTNTDNEVAGLTSSKKNMVNIGGVITGNWKDKQIIIGSGGTDPTATLDIYPATTSTVGVIVSGVKSHSVDLQQWRVQDTNSVQTTRMSVDRSGILVFNDAIPSAIAPSKSIFIDSANNKFTFKDSLGQAIQLEDLVAASTTYIPPAVISFTGSSGTLGNTTALASADNKYIRCQYNGSEPYITISVPHTDFWNPDVGTEVIFEQDAGVNVSVLASGGGVLVNSAYTRTSAGQYSVMSIKKVDSNTWTLTGDLQ